MNEQLSDPKGVTRPPSPKEDPWKDASGASHQVRVLRFGPFELDLATDELRRHGVPIKIKAQAARLLGLLASRAGEVVLRDEIRDFLWPPGTHVEVDQGINACIRQIRQALGDDAGTPHFIETLPRRGYRLLASRPSETGHSREKNSRPERSKPSGSDQASLPQGRSWLPWGLAVLMVAALLGLQLTRGYLDPPAPEVAFERPVIAVLPFANLGNDKELEPLADGLTEELISQLGGQFPNRLAVLARTSTVLYKNTKKSAATIAEELGADYLLESSLRGEAGRLRITVQLIDGKDQTHLWAENYDREPEGLLDFQREISSRIAQTLAGRLLPAAVPLAQEPSAEAYLAYLKGVYKLNQQSREAWQEAREYFEEALVQAPDFARAHWGLGRVLAINVRNSEELRRSEEELRLALRLDPSLADAHLSLSRLQLFILRDFRGAKESLQRALELRPDDSETLHQWANWASAHGLHKEALQAVERSRELDPLSASVQADAGLYEYFAGHWQRAVAVSAETLLLEPEHPWARQAMALSLLQENTWTAESWEERFRAPLADMLGVEDGEFTQLVGRYWRQRLEEMKALPDANILKQGEMAVASLALGDTPKALDYLEAAADPGFAWVLIYLRVHPLFEPLRTNPRFEALVNRFSPPREG